MLKEIKHRDFANGSVYLLRTEDGYPIETTDTFLPYYTKNAIGKNQNRLKNHDLGSRKERWMIGISTMSGCPVHYGGIMKIGLFGGAFDPIHNGHLMLAEQARTQLGLDEIVFIPCGKSPYIDKKIKTSGKHREIMTLKGFESNLNYRISGYEIWKKNKITYTINTIRYIKNTFYHLNKRDRLYLILGPDITPESFKTWKDSDKIRKLCTVARAGIDFWIPDIGIRSTLIRKMVAEGKTIKHLVPHAVEKYIVKHNLYK
jgi:nicotinate-nucleotide adenylyltransferase